ncbi:MAG: 6-phosphogluconolactonase [Actinomycetota bacterium]
MDERVEVLPDPDSLADHAASVFADAIRTAIGQRGRCTLALSGGQTPAATLKRLAIADVDWTNVDVVQVDERVVPDGHPDRNLTLIQKELIEHVAGEGPRLHPMRVVSHDLDAASRAYAETLEKLAGSQEAGSPPALDVVQLGLGPDGHTASLFPGDAALEVRDRWVTWTPPHHGYLRMTLTYPVLAASRLNVFLVEGADRAEALRATLAGELSVPAARLSASAVRFLVDAAAARAL